MIRNTLGLWVPESTQAPKMRAALLAAVSGETTLLPAETNQGRLRQLELASALGADVVEDATDRDIAKLYNLMVQIGAATPYDSADIEQEPEPLEALAASDERELATI